MGTKWRRRTTRRRKRKKRTSSLIFEIFRHPLPSFCHPTRRRLALFAMLVPVMAAGVILAHAAAARDQTQTNSHAHNFVIFASVFNSQGFALPGAKVRVRRADERKFRWEAISDSRGELGIRVKQRAEYELTIEARGFKSQTRKIDAREGTQEDLTLQMEPLTGGRP
jgi:Carboxypeptidase regulatory-like domain